MKRTRRIEVVRYSRRVTVSQGKSPGVDVSAEQQPGDSILDAAEGMPPASEQPAFDASRPSDAVTEPSTWLPSLRSLGELLRLRGRT